MTCRPFGASEALGAGFLNRVVPEAELDGAVEVLAAQLVASELVLAWRRRPT